jgi:anti-sigma regulatory factor (Ser/Thr protein kinase)
VDEWQVFRIEGDAQAPSRARAVIDTTVGERFGPELLSELKLLVSEVVTNSVRHGGTVAAIQLELAIGNSAGLRVDIVDQGRGFSGPGGRRPRDEVGGWGLYLVEQLSDAWGIEDSDSTRVWFQLGAERCSAAANQTVLSVSA